MSVIWYKIWSDIWHNKSRTGQVVLIIAMGAFAIGMILGASAAIRTKLTEEWRASNPAMIILGATPRVTDEQLTALKSLKGVEEVEGIQNASLEWRLSPDQPWSAGGLIARTDYNAQTYNKFKLLSGRWPAHKGLAVEKNSDVNFNIHEGDEVYVRINDHLRLLRVEGVVYNRTAEPAGFGGQAQFYASRDEFTNLTGEQNFDQIQASAPIYDGAALKDLADRMQRQLEKLNIETAGAAPGDSSDRRVSDPQKHFLQAILDAIFLILGVMGVLALILGLLLVYNTITAIVGQQVTQIGVMKAIGASTDQILLVYFSGILIYGLLALLIAIPLSAVGAQQLSNFLLHFFNMDPGPLTLSSLALETEAAIALLAPLLAALVPIFAGARTTVREAISTYGLGGGNGRLERLLAGMQRISRMVVLTLNNTFRNRGRVIVTQLALVGSGLIFMMIMTVQDSVGYTFGDVLFSILRFDISMRFEEPERMQEVEQLARVYPGVKQVEMWGLTTAKIRPAGQAESNADPVADVLGVPLPTTFYGPQLRLGRWLRPDDARAVVLNQKLAERIGLQVGDWVTFNFGNHGETQWQVVGLIFDPIITTSANVPRRVLLRATDSVNKANTIWVQTDRADAAREAEVAKGLRAYYAAHKLKLNPRGTFAGQDTASAITDQILSNFGVIIKMLAAMAVIIALVGSIALSGVLSLNVRERTREIGIMRAIGASSWTIARLFIGEGLILGLLSWLIALPLSLPAGYLMTQAMGAATGGEIVFHYTPAGALYWLVIITVLAIAASWLPAQGATRVSVRESLAYQ